MCAAPALAGFVAGAAGAAHVYVTPLVGQPFSVRATVVLVFADTVDGLAINPPEHDGAPFDAAPARTNVDCPLPDCRLTDDGIENTVVAEQVMVVPDCVQVVLDAPFACALTLIGIMDATAPATSPTNVPTDIC